MTQVVIDDRVFKALKKRLLKLGRMGVRVGVLGTGKGNQAHTEDVTMLELATVQHLGSPKNGIPARPFITDAIKANRKEQAKVSAAIVRNVIRRGTSNKTALDTLGVWATGKVKMHVLSGPHMKPPNAPATLIAKTVGGKKGNRPLVDKGRMINAVTHEVTK